MLYQTKLSPSDKLDLLLKTAACQAYGAITSLANEFSVSRKAIYTARTTILNAFKALSNRKNDAKYMCCIAVDKSLLHRTIIALSITAPNSICAIQEQISIIYPGISLSFGYIQGIIKEAQEKSAVFNKTVTLNNIESIAVDEMFSQGAPVLAGIDLDSGYLFSLSHETSRDGATWERVLKEAQYQGMEPKYVVKDGAKGIAKGVELTFDKIEQRDDAFHAIYLAGKVRLKLEHIAYRHIGYEAEAQKKQLKGSSQNKRSLAKSLDWAKKKCTLAIDRYTLAAEAVQCIRMAFCSVNFKTGELITPETAQQLLTQAVVKLRETQSYDGQRIALYVENRITGLTLATSKTYKHLSDLMSHYSEDAISLTCRLIERKRKLKKMPPWKQKRVHKEMVGTYYFLCRELDEKGVHELMRTIEMRLQSRHMASSAIEGFNATLRSYLYVRKGVNQGFLELFKAWYNLRNRRWGRNQGTSAYGSLTGEPVTDWLSLIGYPPSKIIH